MQSVFSSSLPDIKTLHTLNSRTPNGLRLPPINKPNTAPIIEIHKSLINRKSSKLNEKVNRKNLRPSKLTAPPPPSECLIKFNSILDDYAIGKKLGEGSCS